LDIVYIDKLTVLFIHILNECRKSNFSVVKTAVKCFHVDRTGKVGGNNMRDRSTISRLQMYRNFKAKRSLILQQCLQNIDTVFTVVFQWC